MSAQDLEQRARELLAAEWERDDFSPVQAQDIRDGYVTNTTATALRAIVAALRQQPAPVDLEQFREAVQAWKDKVLLPLSYSDHDAERHAKADRLLSIIDNAGKVEQPGTRKWMAEVCLAAAASLEAHGVLNEQLPKVADWIAHQPAPVVDDAAAALEAAREDARSGDWVLVPRELPRDALNYLAGFDMDSVGNSTGDAASECWGELVSMAANEVHELEFSNPVFHAGTNLTVRRGTKWYGREWAVVKVGEARVIVKLSTMTHKLSRLDDHWLRHEHDPACRTVAGIVAEMQRVYPGFDAYEDVTLVSFALPGPIAALARAQGVQS